jgi:hypothetical protein
LDSFSDYWAAGYIPKYRTEKIDAPILVTGCLIGGSGNPLYGAIFIMGLGWALMVWMDLGSGFYCGFLFFTAISSYRPKRSPCFQIWGAVPRIQESVPSLFPSPGKFMPDTSPTRGLLTVKGHGRRRYNSFRMNILVTALISGRLYHHYSSVGTKVQHGAWASASA